MKTLRSIVLILGSMVIVSLLIACGSAAEAEPEAVSLPRDAGEVPRISPQELKDRLDSGEDILLIDTRSSGTYDAGHIPGSIIEPDDYENVPRDQVIVTYCS